MRTSFPVLLLALTALSIALLFGRPATAASVVVVRDMTGVAASGPGVIRGDVDENGEINSIDALLILQFEAGTIIPPPRPEEYYKKADANQSGWVDSLDALLILQFHAGLIDNL